MEARTRPRGIPLAHSALLNALSLEHKIFKKFFWIRDEFCMLFVGCVLEKFHFEGGLGLGVIWSWRGDYQMWNSQIHT